MEIYKECEKIKEQIKDYAFEVYGIDLDGLYSISESSTIHYLSVNTPFLL